MSWKTGKYIGVPPSSRFGHTSTAIGPHLLIFGGWEYSKAQNEIIVLWECTSQLNSRKAESEKEELIGNGELEGSVPGPGQTNIMEDPNGMIKEEYDDDN